MSKSLDRLSKIIAQADRAGTEEERATYMEKAQEMSALIGVELAVARAHHAAKERELPIKRAVQLNDWSAKPQLRQAMFDLWCAVADNHDLRYTFDTGLYRASCYGLPSDIDLSEKLYTTLAVQMVREADEVIKHTNILQTYGVNGRVWRFSFYEGFAARVSGRLWEAKRKAAAKIDDAEPVGSTSTAIVLRDKKEEINAFYEEETAHLKIREWRRDTGYTQDYTGNARRAGSAAADRANIGARDNDLAGGRKELA